MPYLHILEKQTWLTAGLRREFPEFQREILHRDRAADFLQLHSSQQQGLKLLDMDALPEQAVQTLLKISGDSISRQTLVLVNRQQVTVLREILQSQCLCYIEKPVSIFRLGQLCRQFLKLQQRLHKSA